MAMGWQTIVQEDAKAPAVLMGLRTLVAAARGQPAIANDVPLGVELVLDRATKVDPLAGWGPCGQDADRIVPWRGRTLHKRTSGPCLVAMNRINSDRIQFILFGTHNRTPGPCLVAIDRIVP
jgi:hypothetical protein